MKNVLRTLIFDSQVSLTLIDATAIVQEAIKLHKLKKTSAVLLGKALSAMTFTSACLKQERGEISLSLQCDGECGNIGVSGNYALALRGFIENTKIEAEADERACLGENGVITIIRDDGYRRPFVGTCAIPKGGDLDEAFRAYYTESEQLPTRLKTVVEIDENGRCTFAGAVVLQPLPFANETALKAYEESDLRALINGVKTKGLEDTAKDFFKADKENNDVWELRTAVYKCNCSKSYISRVLVTLGESELLKLIEEDGSVKIHCHYCNRDYEFTEKDAREIFNKS